ncbi:MAG TPA: VWA domain-containing protein [Terracidiphilus sp.]|nr:VWA domain-containing protein [Terracidiphilus sp.]
MRPYNKRLFALLFAAAAWPLFARTPAVSAGQNPSAQAASQTAPLTVDQDPVRSPDTSAPSEAGAPLKKQGGGYVLKTNVEEVVLNATVLEGNRLVPDLKEGDFEVYEDGVQQKIISFQHTDLPVSMGLVIDNSGSMYKKRPAVNEAALDLVQSSNPEDQAFVVNFSDEAFLDQDFTSSIAQLRQGLSHIDSRGGTALYDAVAASADHLVEQGKRPKQVLVVITDGDDNASTLTLEQTIRRVQQLSGPVIYCIGLLYGDEMSREEIRHAHNALEMLATETGGIAFFPKSLNQVDEIAAEVAQDIRNQYTIGYRSTRPMTDPGFRTIKVLAAARGMGKLTVRTRTGYFPSVPGAGKSTLTTSGN